MDRLRVREVACSVSICSKCNNVKIKCISEISYYLNCEERYEDMMLLKWYNITEMISHVFTGKIKQSISLLFRSQYSPRTDDVIN